VAKKFLIWIILESLVVVMVFLIFVLIVGVIFGYVERKKENVDN